MTPDPIPAGDAALLLELEPRIDATVNARAIAIASEMRQQRMAGIRDVISTYRSVAVHFDPMQTEVNVVRAALQRACNVPVSEHSGRQIEVPVVYGGEEGPDLVVVARFAGIAEADVIRRHSEPKYRVFMQGFVPGFAYMGLVDPVIAIPRRSTPRLTVPAGSVGIAGSQTAIYPRKTPGGWQIIGRTDVTLFDEAGDQPALLAPGDLVTFTPVLRSQSPRREGRDGSASRSMNIRSTGSRAITVVSPGLLTTIQDLGRWGHQHEGVSVSGAMDTVSHRVANRCVGNSDMAATLEVTILGPELRMETSATLAIAGADLDATLDGVPVALQTPTKARAGATLRFGARRSGARAYVAFDGGIDVAVQRGSRATHLPSAMGGWCGRSLRAGDRLPLGDGPTAAGVVGPGISPVAVDHVRLRVIPGPQREFFDDCSLRQLTRATFTVSPNSNRMAYRLTATESIPRANDQEMISDAVFVGGIQVTPAGEAILLMADRQTTGGYPQIATVISADLPAAGQLAPGDTLSFERCTPREAKVALEAQEGRLRVDR